MPDKRPIRLQNYRSRRIVEADSITEFCKKVRLKSVDKYHFTAILNGERLHHKGWHLPYEEEHIICDIYGNHYPLDNLVDFARRHKLHITRLQKLINQEIPHYNGLYLLGQEPPPHLPKPIHHLYFSNKDKKFNKTRVVEVADNIGTSPTNVYQMLRGEKSHVKGWKLDKIELKKKKGKIL